VPIAAAPDPAAAFRALWQDAEGLRLKARFLTPVDGDQTVRSCEAMIRIGLAALARGGNSSVELAGTLADAVDEARYCYPETGPGGGLTFQEIW
jgi:hypothetical protein